MHRRIYDQLKFKPKLQNKKISLQSANGSELKVDGCINVHFCIGGTEMSQDFYVVRDLNRNLILGLDWLKENKVRLYFDLKCLRINGKHYVNLEEDIHVASTVRMKRTCVLTVQTSFFFAVLAFGVCFHDVSDSFGKRCFAFSFAPFCSVFNKKERLCH